MGHVIFAFQRGNGVRGDTSLRRQRSTFLKGLGRWISESREQFRRARVEAQLAHSLEGYNEHLLRDMGLTWSGRRIKSIDPSRNRRF